MINKITEKYTVGGVNHRPQYKKLVLKKNRYKEGRKKWIVFCKKQKRMLESWDREI